MDKQTWVCVDEAAVTIRPHASPVEQQRSLVVSCWLEGRPCMLFGASQLYTFSSFCGDPDCFHLPGIK